MFWLRGVAAQVSTAIGSLAILMTFLPRGSLTPRANHVVTTNVIQIHTNYNGEFSCSFPSGSVIFNVQCKEAWRRTRE